jgi:hypothetical protein
MPVLKDIRQIKELELPSFPGSKVSIYSGILALDFSKVVKSGLSETENMMALLPKIIKEWNLTKEDGSPFPISEEAVNLLPVSDLEYLMTSWLAFVEEQKKSIKSI